MADSDDRARAQRRADLAARRRSFLSRPRGHLATLALLITGLAACTSTSTPPVVPTGTATTAKAVPIVRVLASSTDCESEPAVVPAGKTVVRATGNGIEEVRVVIFGPKDGRFNRPLGKIGSLSPGATKAVAVTLPMGAYEIACLTEEDEHRTRLTAV